VVYSVRGLDEPPPSADKDFTKSDFSTESTLEIPFDLADKGKMLYYRARWENNVTVKGDSSLLTPPSSAGKPENVHSN
jgi:hypothetical protein